MPSNTVQVLPAVRHGPTRTHKAGLVAGGVDGRRGFVLEGEGVQTAVVTHLRVFGYRLRLFISCPEPGENCVDIFVPGVRL